VGGLFQFESLYAEHQPDDEENTEYDDERVDQDGHEFGVPAVAQ
jgi:hypothetical protein